MTGDTMAKLKLFPAAKYSVVSGALASITHVPTLINRTVLPLTEQPLEVESRLYVTVPLDALALTVYEPPTTGFAGSGDVKDMDWLTRIAGEVLTTTPTWKDVIVDEVTNPCISVV